MSRRVPETLADYLVVAICPTLIGLLVGSLMYFLVGAFYASEGQFQILWILTCFVVAIVGVARISMERGYGYASMFGVPLAGALCLVLTPLAWPLLGLIWWATHKLTWDCTLVDDTQDASGQGLLQQMGLDESAKPANAPPPGTTAAARQLEARTSEPEEPLPWWQTLLEADHRPHAPGVWVIYFSLAALPLFGIGGWFVSTANPDVRQRVFWCLVVYVACGLGLLLATSFLGLRRYLRQRRLEMPLEMTATWLIAGVALIVTMLAVATVLPRPSAEYSLSRVPYALAWTVRKASSFAILPEGIKDDESENVATTSAKEGQETKREGGSGGKVESKGQKSGSKAKKGGKEGQAESESSSGESGEGKGEASSDSKGSQGGGKKGKGGSGDKSKGDKSGGGDSQQEKDSQQRKGDSSDSSQKERQRQSLEQDASQPNSQPEQPAPPQDSRPPLSQSVSQMFSGLMQILGMLIRWLFYAALLIGGVIAVLYYRDELWAAWQKLLDELRALFAGWFRRNAIEAVEPVAPQPPPPRLFSSYDNPFESGAAGRMSWPELVRYTFEAVEAWSREHECPRLRDQTPLEFAQLVGSVEPAIAAPLQSLAVNYSQLAYASRSASRGSVEPLRQLWGELCAIAAQH